MRGHVVYIKIEQLLSLIQGKGRKAERHMCSLHVRLRKEITPDSKRGSVYVRNKCKTSIVYVPGRDSGAKERYVGRAEFDATGSPRFFCPLYLTPF
jgi:hypothetical protein